MKPDHLLVLAEREARPATSGQPRNTELKRAVSTAYYAVFHSLLWAIAETFVPAKLSLWKSRVLFYRALDHRKARDRCKRLGQKPLQSEEVGFFKFKSFSDELRLFANHFVRLQELRHRCDYDPEFKISKGEAQQAIQDARVAISSLHRSASRDERSLFLAYLLFGIRSP
jgi:uncharacterized protein (UPF0332 family)